ncbi:MAG: molybdopterin-dependent oxidoreductase [Sulfurimonas sp.]|uniref:molybdopterin-dependent oxidoreductase n=1 Tax=Sulfurimonas sp. TaxID=2022749 RepID=UPI0026277D64|nr:molybdopterin-dependent oxidoreductase [Sulfurimonas sp.]MCW8894364.1 molybdopterin-dependent oxidoreductase [Sulfurimonas sp.]MCW8954268.1 molybdopterin-dependent oxidoreductase [Sulfurimonas sp.]MCW9066950.1 molybdopterin-dependent oxidoreductase [Sulfurimonas sp.]
MIDKISSSDVVILWGIDSHVDSDAFFEVLKDKKTIVIDPVKTEIAKEADLHIEIKSDTDLFFAMLLSRFLYIYDNFDKEFVEKYASDYEEYHELTQGIRIVSTLKKIGLDVSAIQNIIELIENKKVMIVCGKGVNKDSQSDDTVESINAIGVMLGLFDKEGCGVMHVDKDDYKDGFDIKEQKFEFLEEFDLDILKDIE